MSHTWLLNVPYDMRNHAQQHGATYDPVLRETVYTGDKLPSALAQYRAEPYSWRDFLERHKVNKEPIVANPRPDFRTGSFTLRPDQEEDVQTLLSAHAAGVPEVLNGSLTGVGKTVVGVATAKRLPNVRRILVIAPLSVLPGWRTTLQAMGDGGKQWVLINYQSVQQLITPPARTAKLKKKSSKNAEIARNGVARLSFDVVITDESHYISNLDSLTFAFVEKVTRGRTGRDAWVMRMSATAGSDPAKLGYLYRAFAHAQHQPIPPKMTTAMYEAWCAKNGFSLTTFRDSLVWKYKKDADSPEARTEIQRMYDLVYSTRPTWALRRRPDWPDQARFLTPFTLTPQQRAEYMLEWSDFVQAMKRKDAARARYARAMESGDAHELALARQENRGASEAGLAAKTRYRQKAGLLRAPSVADFVADLVASGVQVAVSCDHHAVVDAVRERLVGTHRMDVAVFTGLNVREREGERIRFQRGQVPVLLYTPSEGFNLHAGEASVGGNDVPRVNVIAQPRWSPLKMLQVEGRCQRDGTYAPCYYLYAEDTEETNVLHTVFSGMRTLLRMNGDKTDALDALLTRMGVQRPLGFVLPQED